MLRVIKRADVPACPVCDLDPSAHCWKLCKKHLAQSRQRKQYFVCEQIEIQGRTVPSGDYAILRRETVVKMFGEQVADTTPPLTFVDEATFLGVARLVEGL